MENYAFPAVTKSYERLIDTIRKRPRPVVAWIGAGVSAPAGLPSWKKLRGDLENELRQKAVSEPVRRKELEGRLAELAKQDDPWKAFGMLQSALGEATFRASIRERFANALKVDIPDLYRRLWSLPLDGIINLNIDRLAQRGFTDVFPGKFFIERHGRAVTALIGRITQDRFIANLHGQFEDPTTWVFTDYERSELLKDERYHEFIRDCLKYCTIVFLGISADDVAVLDHFRRAKLDQLATDTHYWLTDREDVPVEVERYGISVIKYANNDGAHRAVSLFLQDASKVEPVSKSPPVVAQVISDGDQLPEPNDLLALSPNLIRKQLNIAGGAILAMAGVDAYAKFDEFCKKYARAILNATYVSNDPEEEADRILDFRIIDSAEDKEGAFGKVWRAIDDCGENVALKIFRYEMREKPAMLRAFRRGIRSLRILAAHNLPGIVGFRSASEVPPVLAMDWVEGPNLQEAVATGMLRDWSLNLRIARDLARIIYSAHNLPERVLHRDIRPANIMLRDFYADPTEAEVVVLDFDLSWHVGAQEQSVHAGAGSAYLAPEQVSSVKGATSRSAAVDSFGFGMTLYYLLTGKEPQSAFLTSWPTVVRNDVSSRSCREWKSLPKRISRLISECTQVDQHRRPLFSQIVYQLETLCDVLMKSEFIADMDLLSEEVMARSPEMVGYEALEGGVFRRDSPYGLRVELSSADSVDSMLVLSITFQQMGTERFQNLAAIGDYFKKIVEMLGEQDLLPKSGMRNVNIGVGNYVLTADIALDDFAGFEKFSATFNKAVHHLATLLARS